MNEFFIWIEVGDSKSKVFYGWPVVAVFFLATFYFFKYLFC